MHSFKLCIVAGKSLMAWLPIAAIGITQRLLSGTTRKYVLSATMHSLKLCADGIDRKSVRLSWHGSLRIGEG